MHKLIKIMANFKKVCMRKLKRNKITTHANTISISSKDFEKKKKEMIIAQKIKLHDRLYDYADKLIKEYNPCKIKDGKCARISMCCGGCKYLTKDGCNTKCLWCKLWLCNHLLKRPEYWPLISKLRKIEKVASRKSILIQRGSREDLARYLQTRLQMRNF